MSEIRLQKYLALAGVASRRKSEELILQGRVEVNDTVITELGTKVSEEDTIKFDGSIISLEERKVYIMLNKPVGYITTAKDQFSRKTVLDLINEVEERIYPVGRLDYDTSGLLLLTNDGDFAFRLTHPGHEVVKTYQAKIKGFISEKDILSFKKGILIDGARTAPAQIRQIDELDDKSLVEIEIHEGRNRQVRKMCEAIGLPVINLKRTAIGKLRLGDLQEGHWRYLSDEEVNSFCR